MFSDRGANRTPTRTHRCFLGLPLHIDCVLSPTTPLQECKIAVSLQSLLASALPNIENTHNNEVGGQQRREVHGLSRPSRDLEPKVQDSIFQVLPRVTWRKYFVSSCGHGIVPLIFEVIYNPEASSQLTDSSRPSWVDRVT